MKNKKTAFITQKWFLYNHLIAKKTFKFFWLKYKVFIFLLFIKYQNFTKIGDKNFFHKQLHRQSSSSSPSQAAP